ncbi:hypothetical protein [Flavivirga sp. 57AJ16]|uniref:hypothetical protein n=1 Tax=Flavivirga sp. 57AJ16 TaxID=3025307 RepID=UPI002366E235|nr:hypothetical protein [Flavivirga sp. 57AJ16]MDD7884787.1 hypothetical protein [Flavivirga sp. 57AJ16]
MSTQKKHKKKIGHEWHKFSLIIQTIDRISSLYRLGIHIHAESNLYHKVLDSCEFVPFVSFLKICTHGSLAEAGMNFSISGGKERGF